MPAPAQFRTSGEPPFFSVRPVNEGRTTNLYIVASGVLFSIALGIIPVAVRRSTEWFRRRRQPRRPAASG